VGEDEARWFAVDGKGLNGSIVAPCEAHQQFVNLVSVFSHAWGLTVATDAYRSDQGSEIETVQQLLADLELEAVSYTLDAMHCQKNGQDHRRAGQRLSDLRQSQSEILV
jgi:spore cortex formation protein SpoVR/YcgB (stage V sporulation)